MDAIHTGALAWLIDGVLVAGLAVSVMTDVRRGKIYDKITLPCLAAGLLIHTLFGGAAGAVASGAGIAAAVGMALAVTLIAGRGLGGGDVKLLAAVGALRGPEFVMWTALFAALSGPFLCLIPLLRQGLLRETLHNFAHNAAGKFLFQAPVEIAAGSRAGKQPFGVAIALGALLAAIRLAWM